jgi:hypothetical protein
MTNKKKDLSALMQSLPQELYDAIFEYAKPFDGPQAIIIDINKTYKPPTFLHMTHASRSNYDPYFATNVFSFDNLEVGFKWLKTMRPEHRRELLTIRCNVFSHPHHLYYLMDKGGLRAEDFSEEVVFWQPSPKVVGQWFKIVRGPNSHRDWRHQVAEPDKRIVDGMLSISAQERYIRLAPACRYKGGVPGRDW